ncbi:MAG TPA: hypothetical protein PK668_10995 [Myxococcota bacterium]|nr:hypothetical protein [Myxococcota bacterium]HRY93309.1 hypothetical protein [Myxococcota bacterium]HSA19892.1 hypothetical protein [Myxococcota bacterium]
MRATPSPRWILAWAGLLLAGLGCVLDEMDPTGKACDETHPCPAGYNCRTVSGIQGCAPGLADGGDGSDGEDDGDGADGADDGGPACSPDEARCRADGLALERCDAEGSGWNEVVCGAGSYCLAPPAGAPACVAQCDEPADCPTGMYCDPADSRCELLGDCTPLGEVRCNNTFTRLMICDPLSHLELVQEDCAGDGGYCDPWDVSCKPYCDHDADCAAWTGESCDQGERKCVSMGLCTSDSDCAGSTGCHLEGTDGVCLEQPTVEATTSSDPVEPSAMGCYVSEPVQPSATPATCNVEGLVTEFFSRAGTPDTVGLTVRVHRQEAVLDGELGQSLQAFQADAGANGYGHYRFVDLPTNTELVFEVLARPGTVVPLVYGFARLLTFGVYLNADECGDASGELSLSLPAIYQDSYDGYADPAGLADTDPAKGVVLAQAKDCDGARIWHAVGGLSLPHEHFFYLDPQPAVPNVDLTETSQNGWFGAANATPIRGLVAAWALSAGLPVSLWLRPVRVFPGSASLVLFEKPNHPRAK